MSSLHEKGKHKSGGQSGHKGERLKQVETADIIKKHKLSACPGCQKSLILSPIIKLIKGQVFDIPVPKIQVTEHQAEVKYCGCCNIMVTVSFITLKHPPIITLMGPLWFVFEKKSNIQHCYLTFPLPNGHGSGFIRKFPLPNGHGSGFMSIY